MPVRGLQPLDLLWQAHGQEEVGEPSDSLFLSSSILVTGQSGYHTHEDYQLNLLFGTLSAASSVGVLTNSVSQLRVGGLCCANP